MSKTIGSKEYNEWLNSPLTKALKRSFEQSITDPENQPSQYGTVTLAMYEHLEEQITTLRQRVQELEEETLWQARKRSDVITERDALRQRVAELEKERDKATQYWQIAEGRCDALMKQRDELLAALEEAIDAVRVFHGHVGWEIYRDHSPEMKRWQAAIASVKEKQNAAD